MIFILTFTGSFSMTFGLRMLRRLILCVADKAEIIKNL